jgi:DNA helicase-2/ATP-dependent DNA helicase PcrA
MQSVVDCVPSPFLDEIPANLVEYHEPETKVSDEKALEFLQQMMNKFTI